MAKTKNKAENAIGEISPRKMQEAAYRGIKRLSNFQSARVFQIQEYIGPYYDRLEGEVGTSPLNMIFNAIRVLVPTLVLNFPKHVIETPYLAVKQYSQNLALALSQHDMKINIRDVYRRIIVDAIFTLGIMKTGLCQSDTVYAFDDEDKIDPGTVFTMAVDFDNFVVDSSSREHMFADAKFMGDKNIVPRQSLLDSGLYDEDLVKRLPKLGQDTKNKKAEELSMQNINIDENYDLEDDVEIIELWVPSANAVITIPASEDVSFDEYLRVADYYGVKEGPYSLLSLTPPVPGNPLPVPMVGVWYDLHVLANRMAKKICDQAERQKSVTGYKRTAADDAEQLRDANDGDMIAMDDPDAAKQFNFGGQQNSNEVHLVALMDWFNLMAANPEQLGGNKVEGKSATAANILQQNASIGLEDMKDLVYVVGAAEARKRAWYFHTDPLMKIPLIRRQQQPGSVTMGPDGQPAYLQPPKMEDVQVILTPEARRGDFLDFVFKFEPESMGRVDSKARLQQAMALCQQILPAVMTAAQVAQQLGVPFSAKAMILNMARDSGIEWMDQVFYDPEFQQQMQMQMAMGPQAQESKGQIAGQPNQGMMPAILQNGQPGQVQGTPPGAVQLQRQQAQSGANDSQALIRRVIGRSISGQGEGKPALANANAF